MHFLSGDQQCATIISETIRDVQLCQLGDDITAVTITEIAVKDAIIRALAQSIKATMIAIAAAAAISRGFWGSRVGVLVSS